jgi:membrane fusion protein, multidrug efflux system
MADDKSLAEQAASSDQPGNRGSAPPSGARPGAGAGALPAGSGAQGGSGTSTGTGAPAGTGASAVGTSSAPTPTSATATAPAAAPTPPQAPGAGASKPQGTDLKRLIPIAIFSIAALLFFAIASCWVSWTNTYSLKTDDAYVHTDIAPLSTRERGIVLKTFVKDYQEVKPGQLLIELRCEDFRDRVNQAEQAASEVQLKIDDMKSRKTKLDSQIKDADAALENSRDALSQFDSTIEISKASIEEAKANLAASEATIKQSDASVLSAQADVEKSGKQRKREEALLSEESSTKETVEQVVDEHERAIAALQSQQAAKLKAHADYLAKKAQLLRANQQLSSVLIDKKRAATTIQSREAEVTARTMERKLLDGEEDQLKTVLAAKKSATDVANVDLGYTQIKAPVAGIVGELKVKPGQFVNAGTQVITLVSSEPWVIANFRETQTANIKVGQEANITADALPGKHWRGHVESIAPASGAQFSLLPPDNASGNFTKITQRIPVKVTFDEKDQDLSSLRPGMSVTVAIAK